MNKYFNNNDIKDEMEPILKKLKYIICSLQKLKQFLKGYKSEINEYLELFYQLFKHQTCNNSIHYINLLDNINK